jgi:monovalent cation:H+ antiporter-2, CPA2 family
MEILILRDIVIIFALSTFVNFLFTKIKVPAIVGYLLTGIVAGPHLLAIIHSPHEIEVIAEIGVVLLLFTIGLEFSLKHLLRIRRIVFFGGFLQLSFTALITTFISRMYGLNWNTALFIGFLTALSSTAVVLKLLQERSEITSNYGRTVVGILIFQDIILIPLLLLPPILAGESSGAGNEFLSLAIKAVLIIGFVYIGNKWLMPKLLHLIALTKNQELFLMSILLICLSVALLTYQLGMSLAFGAFLAGLMISESEYSHNAFGHLIPFKDTFTSFFFVSIGMLLDLSFVFEHFWIVVGTIAIVIVVKTIIAGGTGFILGHTFRGTVLVGLALSQVGEFSFILAKVGFDYAIITGFYYQLFLAVAVITMSLSPFLIYISSPLANTLLKLPLPTFLVEGLFPLKEIDIPEQKNHIVIIGKDSRALSLSVMSKYLDIPYVSVIFDPGIVREKQKKGETVIYGDAVNEPILQKAYIETAEIVVVSVGNLITSMAIIDKIRGLNKHVYIIVRTKQVEDIEELYKLGADQVIPEEFETAIEMFERVLGRLLIPRRDINQAVAKIRNDYYGIFRDKTNEKGKSSLLNELPNIEISAIKIDDDSKLVDKSVLEIDLRKTYEITLVAIKRGEKILQHPGRNTIFKRGDIAYILGNPEKIADAIELFTPEVNKTQ